MRNSLPRAHGSDKMAESSASSNSANIGSTAGSAHMGKHTKLPRVAGPFV